MFVGEADAVALRVAVAVPVAVTVGVALPVPVRVGVAVVVPVRVGVTVNVALGVRVGVAVSVAVRVLVLLRVGVCDGVAVRVRVAEGVRVAENVRVLLGVEEGPGVAVAMLRPAASLSVRPDTTYMSPATSAWLLKPSPPMALKIASGKPSWSTSPIAALYASMSSSSCPSNTRRCNPAGGAAARSTNAGSAAFVPKNTSYTPAPMRFPGSASGLAISRSSNPSRSRSARSPVSPAMSPLRAP